MLADDDDALSPEARAALLEFLAEQLQQQKPLTASSAITQGVSEDWELSQFWYDENTAKFLADEAIRCAQGGRIACVSTPSLFRAVMKQNYSEDKCKVFEYDTRFRCFGNQFIFYDLNNPTEIPTNELHSYDFVCADPPFLNAETISKILLSCSLLAKNSHTPVLLLTGAVLESAVAQISQGTLIRRPFIPKHEGTRLKNEFAAFSNFEMMSK